MRNKTLLSVLALLIVTGVFFAACQNAATTSQNSNTTATESEQANDENPTTAASNADQTPYVYEDGEYIEQGIYQSPAGEEKITVTVRLKSDTIEGVELASDATTDEKSKNFQKLFLEGLQQEIVGKNLADIGEFTKLNGASLTSQGFNEALVKIKEDAKN